MLISFNYRFEIWYIVICTIANGIKAISSKLVENHRDQSDDKKNIKFVISTVKYSATIFHIIFYEIEKKLSKRKNKEKDKIFENKKFKLILGNKKPIYLLIINFFFFIIYVFLSNQIKKYKFQLSQILEFTIYCISLLIIDIFFYSKKYYPQHIITFIIFLIDVLIVTIYFFVIHSNDLFLSTFIFLNYFYKNYTATFALFVFKYLNTKFFISMFVIIFFEGISKMFSLLFFGFLEGKTLKVPIDTLDFLLLFIYFIASIIYTFTKCRIIEKLRPTHFGLSLFIYYLLLPVFNFTFEFKVLDIFIGIFSFLGCLIYCEILVFHFLNLDKKTMEVFRRESIMELNQINNDDNE